MGKILIFSFTFVLLCFVCSTNNALAIENPLNTPNNKVGVHIIIPEELKPASQLVNSNGGDWGYVTITIQAGDKNIVKWQAFMDKATQYHLIPILRLATEGDYFNTKVWRKPTDADIVDFANFLNSLDWPVKNRYVMIFNEVNRSDEWGGSLNPSEYAQFLSFAVTVFKSRSSDYFILPAGLDNAAPNQPGMFMNEYDFMRQMNSAVPGIFNQVDGLSSHSYPNPGFSQLPSFNSPTGINSFQYEENLVKNLSNKTLPVFITETGWSTQAVSDDAAGGYYVSALTTTWSDPNIVAVTPFVLQGNGGPFQQFTFIKGDGTFTKQYLAIKNLTKSRGKPTLANKVLAAETTRENPQPIRDFSKQQIENLQIVPSKQLKTVFKWLLRI